MDYKPLKKGRDSDELLDEERKGLLSASHDHEDVYDPDDDVLGIPPRKSRRWLYTAATGFILLLLGAVFGPPLLRTIQPQPKPVADFDSQKLRSNGTHLFKKTALIVSIDGLRADYLDRGFTPHLLAIAKKGLRAKSMRPIFPTLTFPLLFE